METPDSIGESNSPLICPVCLDPLSGLTAPSTLATLPCCAHVYHEECIMTWSQRTNSCPACRAKFNKVILRKDTPCGEILNEYQVKDTVAPIPDDYQWEQPSNNIAVINGSLHSSDVSSGLLVVGDGLSRMADSMILVEDDDMGLGVRYEEESPDWDCALCLYGETSHRQLLCRNCSQEVHVYTADLEEFPFINWYCPGCLNSQISYLNQSLARRRRATTSGSRRGRGRARSGTSTQRGGIGNSSRRTPSSSSSSSVISNLRNRQLRGTGATARILGGSSFGSNSVSPPVVQVEERRTPGPQITQEEREAWEMFEQARSFEEGEEGNGGTDSSNSGIGNSGSGSGSGSGSSSGNSSGSGSGSSSGNDNKNIGTSIDNDTTMNDNSIPPPTSGSPKKLKRPCRRANPQRANPQPVNPPVINTQTLSSIESILPSPSISSASSPSALSEQTLVQSLLCNIRSSSPKIITSEQVPITSIGSSLSSSTSPPLVPLMSPPSTSPISMSYIQSPSPISTMSPTPSATSDNEYDSTNASDTLSLSKKLQVQTIVRDELRPVYRSGKISKEEYTEINKRVSRTLYEHLVKEGDGNPIANPKWQNLVKDYVSKELEILGEEKDKERSEQRGKQKDKQRVRVN